MPAISVILPTRDRPGQLAEALRSVLEQTWGDFEVIVVDNNQQTPAVARVDALRPLLSDPRVHVVTAREASSAGQARNVGLGVAEGEWLTFLDDDDLYRPEKLARQLELGLSTGAPLVLCGFEVVLGPRRRRIQVSRDAFRGDALLLDAVWGTPFLFLHADVLARFADDLRAGEDFHFALQIVARENLEIVPCVAAPLVEVRLQPTAGTRVNTQHEAHGRAQRRALRECRGRFSRAARRRFLLRARMQRLKGDGTWTSLIAAGVALVRAGGVGEVRRVANALAFRTGWLRRWVVS